MDKAFIIFLATYILIAIGQPPLFRIDRTGAAIIGSSLMVITGILSVYDAYEAIDYKTILILFGMMVLIANLRLSGFFNIIYSMVIKIVRTPKILLYAIILSSGILSAFFVNDTVCLIFTPLVVELSQQLRLNPKPYLLAICMSANIGSVATITGNPQNIIIGAASGISYSSFFLKMFPVAMVGFVICAFFIYVFYRKDLQSITFQMPNMRLRYNKALMLKSILVSFITMVLFFAGVPLELVSVGVASFLLITRRVKPDKVYNLVDFRLLILFIGLFIVIKGVEKSDLYFELMSFAKNVVKSNLLLITTSALLSNLVSNVPAVIMFKPLIINYSNSEGSWLLLAMSSTLAGNLTILGSIANIIVIEGAYPKIKIGFFEYLKIGVPVTIITLFMGVIILSFY